MASGMGVIQTGIGAASLLGGGGTTTQYNPTYDAMNEVLMSSVDIQEQIYKNQLQLTNDAFSTNLGLQDAEHKRLISQLVYDKTAQQTQLLSEAIQNEAMTNQAETTLEMQRLGEVYAREAQKVATNMEYVNTIEALNNTKMLREQSGATRENQFQINLKQGISEGKDLQANYDLTKQNQALERDKLGVQYANLSTQEKANVLAGDKAGAGFASDLATLSKARSDVNTAQSQKLASVEAQKQSLMLDFLKQGNQDVIGLANKVAQMSSKGNVDTQSMSDAVNRAQIGNEDNYLTRQNAQAQFGTQIGQVNSEASAANANIQQQQELAQQLYLQQLQQLGLQNENLQQSRIGLDVQQKQMGLGEQSAQNQFNSAQSQQQGQIGSLMNTNMQNIIQQDLAPYLQAQLAQRQVEQQRNLASQSQGVNSMMQDYGYDVQKLGLDYSRQQDAQSLKDYQNMINSQYALNSQAANASYLTGLGNAYAQNASQQSQLGSGYSAGINQVASQVQSTPRFQQPSGQGGFNWQGLGQLASQGYGLLSSGGSQPTTYGMSNQRLPAYDASLYQPIGQSYSGIYQ
jgi:hypothetical protein